MKSLRAAQKAAEAQMDLNRNILEDDFCAEDSDSPHEGNASLEITDEESLANNVEVENDRRDNFLRTKTSLLNLTARKRHFLMSPRRRLSMNKSREMLPLSLNLGKYILKIPPRRTNLLVQQ